MVSNPPYNMAIKHVEPRMYNSPITRMPTSKIGNATCTYIVYSTIGLLYITIPFELKTMLLYEHKILLLHNLGIAL